jgi:hypothetical protein
MFRILTSRRPALVGRTACRSIYLKTEGTPNPQVFEHKEKLSLREQLIRCYEFFIYYSIFLSRTCLKMFTVCMYRVALRYQFLNTAVKLQFCAVYKTESRVHNVVIYHFMCS